MSRVLARSQSLGTSSSTPATRRCARAASSAARPSCRGRDRLGRTASDPRRRDGQPRGRSSWKDFLLALRKRGLNGVELIVADDHGARRNRARLPTLLRALPAQRAGPPAAQGRRRLPAGTATTAADEDPPTSPPGSPNGAADIPIVAWAEKHRHLLSPPRNDLKSFQRVQTTHLRRPHLPQRGIMSSHTSPRRRTHENFEAHRYINMTREHKPSHHAGRTQSGPLRSGAPQSPPDGGQTAHQILAFPTLAGAPNGSFPVLGIGKVVDRRPSRTA